VAGSRRQSAAGKTGVSVASLALLVWIGCGFVVAIIAGMLLLFVLERLRVRQRAYEDAPQTHQGKTGTPTMGGLIFVVALGTAWLIAGRHIPLLSNLLLLVALCAAIGAIDDLMALRAGSNRGLPARTKLLATALAAAIFMRGFHVFLGNRDVLFHAGTVYLVVPHWLWLVLGVVAITATTHAVNLTDGLDGLAAGTIVPPLLLLGIVGVAQRLPAAIIGAGAGAGACVGFLLFNRYPARLFMGDTGSLALGALLAGVAILTGEMLLLILIGGVFVAETLSVIVQVSYFKATGGRRILRMSPLHHHFEMLGWPETKVTLRFWVASLLCSLVGWAIVR
jgi:phospho-N-acetylmuramoyl-pentapeptide-transferase